MTINDAIALLAGCGKENESTTTANNTNASRKNN